MARLEFLDATLEVPNEVLLKPGQTRVDLDIVSRLNNTRSDNFLIAAKSDADIHDWHLLDENHRELQRAPRKPARVRQTMPLVSRLVPATHAHSQHHRIALDARKLRPGRFYTLRFEFWDHMSEAHFVVAMAPSAPAPPRKPMTKKARAVTKKARAVTKKARAAVKKARAVAKMAKPAASKTRAKASAKRRVAKKARA